MYAKWAAGGAADGGEPQPRVVSVLVFADYFGQSEHAPRWPLPRRAIRSQPRRVLGEFPVRDPRPGTLRLGCLDRAERFDQALAKRRGDHLVGRERVKRLLEADWQEGALLVLRQVVQEALDRRRRLELAANTVQAGG